MHDDLCLCEQGLLYLLAGNGESSGVNDPVHGKRERIRSGLCAFVAAKIRTGWRSVFHAFIRPADVSHCIIPDHTDIQGVGSERYEESGSIR